MHTILAGVKTSAIIDVGTATLAALIGVGGLGEPVVITEAAPPLSVRKSIPRGCDLVGPAKLKGRAPFVISRMQSHRLRLRSFQRVNR